LRKMWDACAIPETANVISLRHEHGMEKAVVCLERIWRIKRGHALIRKARNEALEWILAVDQMLNMIIGE
jgi:hypothetical protein